MHLTQHTPQIWSIEGFLEPSECERLIALSEAKGYEEAKVSLPEGAQMIKGLRNNSRLVYEDAALAQSYWERLRPFCPSTLDGARALRLHEQFRFYKYESDQRFKKHIDGRVKISASIESRITFLIYLNHQFEGGETAFEEVIIQLQAGTALCFIHEQKHEGRPVPQGTKYVLRSDVLYEKG